MTRYSVTAEYTGAEYPHYAPALGPGWEFILRYPGEKDRAFSSHTMAHVFADRLRGQIVPKA